MKNRILELKKLIKDKDYKIAKAKIIDLLIEIKNNIDLFGLNCWVKMHLKSAQQYNNNQIKRLVKEIENVCNNLWVIKRVDRLSRLDDLDKIKLCIADYNNDMQKVNKHVSNTWNRLLMCLIFDSEYDLKDICFNLILESIKNKNIYVCYKTPSYLKYFRH